MSTTIYILEKGEYSDYTVGPGFTTREKAQAWIDRQREDASSVWRDGWEISEWELDPDLDPLPEWSWYVVGLSHPQRKHHGSPSWRRYDKRPTWQNFTHDGVKVDGYAYPHQSNEEVLIQSSAQIAVKARCADEAVGVALRVRDELVESGRWFLLLKDALDA